MLSVAGAPLAQMAAPCDAEVTRRSAVLAVRLLLLKLMGGDAKPQPDEESLKMTELLENINS